MTEHEQVIAELKYLKRDCLEGSATDNTINRAIALIKSLEPVEVDEWPDEFLCPTCKTRLAGRSQDDCILLETDDTPNYCWVCGQAVKWDDGSN